MSSPRNNSDSNDFASFRYPKAKLVSLFLSLSPEERSKQFLTVGQAAKLLSLSPRTIKQYINEDKIAAIKVGHRNWRIYVPSIHDFLQQSQD